MKAMANALVYAVTYISLRESDDLDSDVGALESIAADLQRCPELRASSPTPEDVAYAQLFYRVRDLQRASGARWGLEAAVAGERVLVLGLPDEP